MEIELELNKNINDNANIYFQKAKKLKNKLPGVDSTIEKTKNQIKKFEEEKEEYLKKKEKNQKLKIHKKKEWYEKFRYTFTSSNILAVIGKDSGTNEVLIKKHLEENDIILHTQTSGSPFGIIKNCIENPNEKNLENRKLKISKSEIEEIAQFISCFSKQWKKGYGTADAFWVFPEQVSKKAESGEYMSKGSFMIRGKKNIIKNIVLQICIGIIKKEVIIEETKYSYDELFSGSQKACKLFCNNKFLKLEPGTDNYKKLNKELKSKLKTYIEDLPKYIPNNCKILKK